MNKVNKSTFLGIELPWIAAQTVTEYNPETEEWEERDIPPPYIRNLEDWNRTKSVAALTNASLSAAKEVVRYLKQELGLKLKSYEAPVAVSSKVPRNCFVIKDERIIVNENQGTERAWDADADRMAILCPGEQNPILLTEDIVLPNGKTTTKHTWKNVGDWGVPRKYPITVKPELFKRLEDVPTEVFSPLTQEIIERLLKELPTSYNEKELFEKNHQPNLVGIYTNNFDVKELYTGTNLEHRMNILFDDINRLKWIEGSLKASRKDSGFTLGDSSFDIMQWSTTTLVPQNAVFLLGGRTAGMSETKLDWLYEGDARETISTAISKAVNLDILFTPSSQRKPATEPDEIPLYPESIALVDDLVNLGILHYQEIPYSGDHPDGHKLPPVTLIWLARDDTPVALMGGKRGGELSYCYLLPPVFDPEAICTDEDGNWLQDDEDGCFLTEPKWVPAIEHLRKHLAQLDWSVSNPNTGWTRHDPWPRDLNDLVQYIVKTTNLQKEITTFCDRVGDQVPADVIKGKPIPTPISLRYVQHTVYIEYQKWANQRSGLWRTDKMWEICQEANKTVRICLSGCKNANGKFMLAHSNGVAFLADPSDHPARTGKGRSQIVRGLGPRINGHQMAIWMRTAIVMPETDRDGNIIGTLTQVHITPTGVAKQTLPEVGMPKAHTSLSEENTHPNLEERTSRTLTGALRKIWVGDPKKSIKVGKLVDNHANKFVPREIEEHMGDDGKLAPVDLIIPITELLAKANLVYFLSVAKPSHIFSGGRWVPCLIADLPFFRTGAGSENTPTSYRERVDKGLNGMVLRWALRDLDPEIWSNRKPKSIEYAVEIIEAMKQIKAKAMMFQETETQIETELDELEAMFPNA